MFEVSKFKKPPNPLFHPDSLAARKPWLTQGHRKIPVVPAHPVVFYVLYENPPDFPNKLVLRKWWDQTPAKEPLCVATTVMEVLACLPKNVVCIGRNAGDAAIIKDVWTEV